MLYSARLLSTMMYSPHIFTSISVLHLNDYVLLRLLDLPAICACSYDNVETMVWKPSVACTHIPCEVQ